MKKIISQHHDEGEKKCTVCKQMKSLEDYYVCKNKGKYFFKSECKKCTTIRNAKITRKKKRVCSRSGNPAYQAYQRKYYAENEQKFAKYRIEFRQRHPDYFKDRYAKYKAQKKMVKDSLTDADIG